MNASANPFKIGDLVYSDANTKERGRVVDWDPGRGVLVKWDSFGREWEAPEWLRAWEKRGGA